MAKVEDVVEFEVTKYETTNIKSGFIYIANPKTKNRWLRAMNTRSDSIYRLFSQILNLKGTYKFKGVTFKNTANDKTGPPTKYLEGYEMETLEKLANSPVMRE